MTQFRDRLIEDNANDGIIIGNLTGDILYANKRLSIMLGYSQNEFIKLKVPDLVSKNNLEKLKKFIENRLRGNDTVPSQYEIDLIKKDGSLLSIKVSAAMTNWKGQPASMGVFRNITEKKKTKDELQKHRLTAEKYLDIVGNLIIALNKEGRITWWNKTAEFISQYRYWDMLERNIIDFDIFDPKEISALLEEEEVSEIEKEFILKRKEEKKRTISFSINSLYSEDESTGLVFVGKDITFKKNGSQKFENGKYYILKDNVDCYSLICNHMNRDTKGLVIPEALVDYGYLEVSKRGRIKVLALTESAKLNIQKKN
ncbi:MAG: PAS domain S-box protein [Nanoarchaeota archaeon]|nr:PAS domain S-box protein [Nanoarchaeota archaeon]